MGDQGVTDVFGLLGDGNLFIIDSFQRVVGGRFHSVSHEASGVLAAIAYARTTGKVGIATVTHGPALTNTATALVEGVRSRAAVVLLAGDTDVVEREHSQNLAQHAFIAGTGAGFEQVRSSITATQDLATALRRAQLERRPIVLNVPAQFQWEEVEHRQVAPAVVALQPVIPAADVAEDAVGALFAARRPILVAGLGATRPEAKRALLALADRIGAFVATTLQAQGLFHGERNDLGVFGVSATGIRLETMLAADTVVAFGASLNRFTTAHGSLVEGRTVVQIDLDPAAFDRFFPASIAVLGDSASSADAFLAMAQEAEIASSGFASDELVAKIAASVPESYTDVSDSSGLDIRTVLERVEAVVPHDRTLVSDVGRYLFQVFERVSAPEPRAFVSTIAFGSVGLGLASAIGAGVGRPGHPVLFFTGDGGFAMGGLTEFIPAIRAGVDLIVILINDGSFGAEHVQFVRRNLDPEISTFQWPDFGPVITAMGGEGFTVRTLEELDHALAQLPNRKAPVLIDVRVDPMKVPGGHR